MFISAGGMIVRTAASDIRQIGRNTLGVKLVNLKDGDHLIAAARVAEGDEEEGDDSTESIDVSTGGADG